MSLIVHPVSLQKQGQEHPQRGGIVRSWIATVNEVDL
jgi:hypothetical protein